MQQDVRRSEPTEVDVRAEQEPKPNAKTGGFARSFFQFGSNKRDKERAEAVAEQGRLHDRLKGVLELDRALVASDPVVEELAVDELELAEDDAPSTERAPLPSAFGDHPPQTGVRLTERASSELALSQIASWIEEEISELSDEAGPLSLEVPLDADEAAELDAVLAEPEASEPASSLAARPEVMQEPLPQPSEASPLVRAKPVAARAVPPPRAQVKAKPSAPQADDEAPSREPINTLTMARLLATQGYKPRALAVYRELLKRSPDDAALRAEAEALKNAD